MTQRTKTLLVLVGMPISFMSCVPKSKEPLNEVTNVVAESARKSVGLSFDDLLPGQSRSFVEIKREKIEITNDLVDLFSKIREINPSMINISVGPSPPRDLDIQIQRIRDFCGPLLIEVNYRDERAEFFAERFR